MSPIESMQRLTWTMVKPTTDGWYWVKGSPKRYDETKEGPYEDRFAPTGEWRVAIVLIKFGEIRGAGWPWSKRGTQFFAGPIPEPAAEKQP